MPKSPPCPSPAPPRLPKAKLHPSCRFPALGGSPTASCPGPLHGGRSFLWERLTAPPSAPFLPQLSRAVQGFPLSALRLTVSGACIAVVGARQLSPRMQTLQEIAVPRSAPHATAASGTPSAPGGGEALPSGGLWATEAEERPEHGEGAPTTAARGRARPRWKWGPGPTGLALKGKEEPRTWRGDESRISGGPGDSLEPAALLPHRSQAVSASEKIRTKENDSCQPARRRGHRSAGAGAVPAGTARRAGRATGEALGFAGRWSELPPAGARGARRSLGCKDPHGVWLCALDKLPPNTRPLIC